jgi:DNA-binding protein H-NS
MATSVSRIHAQIAKLQQQADALKNAAVKRVQREIELHGLTVEDLFGGRTSVGNGRRARATAPTRSATVKKTAGAKTAKAPKYGDSAGNTWGGMGKRPQWLRDALEQGASIEDFLLSASKSWKPTKATPARKSKTASKTALKKAARQPRAAKKAVEQSAGKAGANRRAKRATTQPKTATTE